MQVKFKAKEKGEQPKLFTQLPHLLECFTKHPLEKHPKKLLLILLSEYMMRTEKLSIIRRTAAK